MTIGDTIREIRIQKGLTQIELAQTANIAVNSLRLYEQGKRNPKRATLQKIANALGVSLYTLRPTLESAIQKTFDDLNASIQSIQDATKPLSVAQLAIRNAVAPLQKALAPTFDVSSEDIQAFAKEMANTAREKRNLTEEEYAREYSKWLTFYEENGIPVENDKLPLPIDAVAFAAFLNNLEPDGQAKALQCVAMLGDIQDRYIRTTNQKAKTDL